MTQSIPSARLSHQFLAFFAERASRGQALALVTVIATEGSSYSKAGQQLLIDDAGEFLGILSGGCLEGDLAERAMKVLEALTPEIVEYDLREDDVLFGLGVGCEGVMRVLLQPLTKESGYEPLTSIINALDKEGLADIEVASKFGMSRFRWLAPSRLLVLGAGLDVDPLLEMSNSLGWNVTVNDHRPAYIERLTTIEPADLRCSPADAVDQVVELPRYDAAIVMSHNLDADRAYLQQLASSGIDFIGLLGPTHRRDRLLADLGDAGDALSGRLRSPVGKRIGGRGPAAIALEVVVELQEFFGEIDQQLSSASRSAGVSISINAGSNSTATTA
ncbi:MAG: XdhC family protein [Gammaproteobacteria bacterium]|nr:XdhC family protein [Gammaproteobacteria bacterium]